MNEINMIRQLAQTDLNLIVTFKAMDRFRNVTRAAEALSVTQSAMSHSLRRLRDVFSDELFVKTPQGMVPTPRCEALLLKLEPTLTALEDLFHSGESFDPSTLVRTFHIHTTDMIEHLLLPHVLDLRESKAPHIKVSFRKLDFKLPKEDLARGNSDLAIAGFFGEMPPSFYRRRVLTDTFGCCVRESHPAARKKMTLDTYCSWPHILVAPGGDLRSKADEVLRKKRLTRVVAVGTSSFLSTASGVVKSNAILTAPQKLLESFAEDLPVRLFPVPFDLPKIQIAQVWHERCHKDEAHKWFREQIAGMF